MRSKKSKNKNALISFSFSRITRFKLIVTKLLLLLRFSLFNKTAESILQHSKHSSICTYIYYNDDDCCFGNRHGIVVVFVVVAVDDQRKQQQVYRNFENRMFKSLIIIIIIIIKISSRII